LLFHHAREGVVPEFGGYIGTCDFPEPFLTVVAADVRVAVSPNAGNVFRHHPAKLVVCVINCAAPRYRAGGEFANTLIIIAMLPGGGAAQGYLSSKSNINHQGNRGSLVWLTNA